VNYGQLAAYPILYGLPTVLLFFFVSKFLSRGMMMGALKG
jgi:ABC-type glycerol-3-phosphate transport system permease component